MCHLGREILLPYHIAPWLIWYTIQENFGLGYSVHYGNTGYGVSSLGKQNLAKDSKGHLSNFKKMGKFDYQHFIANMSQILIQNPSTFFHFHH